MKGKIPVLRLSRLLPMKVNKLFFNRPTDMSLLHVLLSRSFCRRRGYYLLLQLLLSTKLLSLKLQASSLLQAGWQKEKKELQSVDRWVLPDMVKTWSEEDLPRHRRQRQNTTRVTRDESLRAVSL